MATFTGFLGSKLGLAVTLVAAALGVYLLATHTGHVLAAAHYLLLVVFDVQFGSKAALTASEADFRRTFESGQLSAPAGMSQKCQQRAFAYVDRLPSIVEHDAYGVPETAAEV